MQTMKQSKLAKRNILIFAGFHDKALDEMLSLARQHFSEIYITTFNHPRAANKEVYKNYLSHKEIKYIANWQTIIRSVLKNPESSTHYYFVGSMHFISCLRNYIQKL